MAINVTTSDNHYTLQGWTRKQPFYWLMGMVFVVILLVGFGPTYYLRPLSEQPSLTPTLHLHGLVFTAWTILYFAQTTLIRAQRQQLHRRLGIVGVLLLVAMLWSGYRVAVERIAEGRPVPLGEPATFLAFQFGLLMALAALVASAIYFRHQAQLHKRLMLMATLCMLVPAIGRISRQLFVELNPAFVTSILVILLAVGLVRDRIAEGRVHLSYLWGGLAIVVFPQFMRLVVGPTELWRGVTTWLIS